MVVMVSPAPFRQHADIAVELDQLEAGFGAALFQLGHGAGGAGLGEVGLAIERAVVERELAVERHHAAGGQQRQRVDLQILGVASEKAR